MDDDIAQALLLEGILAPGAAKGILDTGRSRAGFDFSLAAEAFE
jgi:hypothetical protein